MSFSPKSFFIDSVDVADYFPEIVAQTYRIFPTGGPHYFSQCTCEVDPIYRQNIWPFIYRLKTSEFDRNKSRIMLGSIAMTKLSYVQHKFFSADKKRIMRNYRRLKEEKTEVPASVDRSIHRIVARCFIPNDDPENKTMVDHINGNRVDYRIENLRWVSASENSKGTPGGKNDPNEIYKSISEKDWFKGKGNNLLKTSKDKYYSQLKLDV